MYGCTNITKDILMLFCERAMNKTSHIIIIVIIVYYFKYLLIKIKFVNYQALSFVSSLQRLCKVHCLRT